MLITDLKFVICYRITVNDVRRGLIATITILIISLGIIGWYMVERSSGKLVVYHAGSMTDIVEGCASILRREGIRVLNEPSGSIDAIRKVVDLGKRCDLVISADYRLIPALMFGEHAKWCLKYASNEMVITYSSKSRYAGEIDEENWLEILLQEDVRVGFSDPNKDPCGYRAVMVLALASLHYDDDRPLRMLREHAGITYMMNESGVYLDCTGLKPDSVKVFVRSKSVDLAALVEAGMLDYAFEYRNVAVSRGLSYVELPDELNLADPELEDWYAKISLRLMATGGETKTLKASPIIYGLTVPLDAQHENAAKRFIKLLLSDEGREILEERGFRPIRPEVVGEAPKWLMDLLGEGD